ncbi:MAG: hypothetical protein H7A40_01280 [Chlamydiales bacterium]|nr:hypothetical protein [Chlamydiales bacterium]
MMKERSVKYLLIILAATTAISLIFKGPIPTWLKWYDPHMWLGLSDWGMHKYFIWQIATYILLPTPDADASLMFLFNTGFTLYLLWTIGKTLTHQKSLRDFWLLFLGSGVFGGACAALTLTFTHTTGHLAGWTPALYGLLIGWMLANQHGRVLVFFAIPMPIKWVILGAAAVTLYLDVAAGLYLQFIASLTAILFGYLYAIIAWETHSPFARLRSFERFLHRLRGKKTKIYNFEVYNDIP